MTRARGYDEDVCDITNATHDPRLTKHLKK